MAGQGGFELPHVSEKAIGIDIGGTKIRSALIDASGTVLTEDERPTPARSGVEAVLAAAAQSAEAVIAQADGDGRPSGDDPRGGIRAHIRVVGVGVPGTVDDSTGIAIRAGNLAGWRNVPLVHQLEQRLKLPVRIINDVRAGAYAEWLWGAGEGLQSPFLYFNVGTGISVALIVDGVIYEGASNAAGEFGHSILDPGSDALCTGCGKRGDVESLVAGPALARAYAQALDEQGLSHEDAEVRASVVLQKAKAGEQPAVEVLDRYTRYLGIALANATTMFNPRLLVLGGGLGTAAALPLGEVREYARQNAYEVSWQAVTIEQARLGSAAGAIGAAGWALAQPPK